MHKSVFVYLFIYLIIVPVYAASDFSVENDDWNGTSRIYHLTEQMGYNTRRIQELEITSPNQVLVILHPSIEIDSSSLYAFFINGGRILIADDFDRGNEIAQKFSVFIGDNRISDSMNNFENNPCCPIITDLKPHQITAGVAQIVTNVPSYLKRLPGFYSTGSSLLYTEIANFPSSSFEDIDYDGVRDQNEKTGDFALIIALTSAKGKIVIISDPSIFINEMVGKGDNEELYKNTISWLTDNDKSHNIVFLDTSSSSELENIIELAKRKLREAKSSFDSNRFKDALDKTNEGFQKTGDARNILYQDDHKKMVESAINRLQKEINETEKDIMVAIFNKEDVKEAKNRLGLANEKLREAENYLNSGDYDRALKKVEDGFQQIDVSKDALYGKVSEKRAQKEILKLGREIHDLENEIRRARYGNEYGQVQSERNSIRTVLIWKGLFDVLPFLFFLLTLFSLTLGAEKKSIIQFFKKPMPIMSEFKRSIKKISETENYGEPAYILGKEFYRLLNSKLGNVESILNTQSQENIGLIGRLKAILRRRDPAIEEVVNKAIERYSNINKKKLYRLLKIFEEIIDDYEIHFGYMRFSINERKMKQLYNDSNEIMSQMGVDLFGETKY